MKRSAVIIMVLVLALAGALTVYSQRRITPVTPPATLVKPDPDADKRRKPESTVPASVVHFHDEKTGNTILIDTLTGSEYVDSTMTDPDKKVVGRIYPLWHAVTVGVDIWDPVMRCLGQHYGLGSMWAELSLHNWIKPIVEVGFGSADNTPDGNNYTYHSPMAPYFKIGVNYNFLYNSTPDYQFTLGLRYGFTSFNYAITDAWLDSDYWGEHVSFSVPRQSCTAGYGEIVAGLKVMVWRNISMGWSLKYHFRLHESATGYGAPWYIPGYGSRNGAITGGFSIMYTIPLNHRRNDPVDIEKE